MVHFWAGKQYGWDAIMMDPGFADGIERGKRSRRRSAAPRVRRRGLLDGAELVALGPTKGLLRVAMDIPKVRGQPMDSRHGKDYYKAAVHRFFGAFYAEIPPSRDRTSSAHWPT